MHALRFVVSVKRLVMSASWRHRLERASEPNGSRAKMAFRTHSGIVLINWKVQMILCSALIGKSHYGKIP